MEEFREVLKAHLEKYPEMEPADCVKLLYQYTFGPEHAVGDEQAALNRVLQECTQLRINEEELFTPIGHYLVRIDLYQALKQYTPEQITRWFVQTAQNTRGSMAEYMKGLKWLKAHIAEFPVSFTQEVFDAYLAYNRSGAYPVPHHSKHYTELYAPHYRVIRVNIWNI